MSSLRISSPLGTRDDERPWGGALGEAGSRPADAACAGGRVVYVVSLFPCWSETFIVREINALLKRGVDVRILSLRHPSEALVQSDARELMGRVAYPPSVPRALRRLCAELARAPLVHAGLLLLLVRRLFASPVVLAKTLVVWWRTLALAEDVRRLEPGRLHAHWATYPTTAALVLSRSLGVPFGFTAHAHDIFVGDRLLADKLEAASLAVTVSEFNRARLAERYGRERTSRVTVIRCGIPLAEFPYEPEGREPDVLLAVGRLDPVKGFRHLIEACALLRDRGRGFSCDIVGDGALRADLEGRVARSGLGDHVRLRGALKQEDLRHYLRRASVFVLPSIVDEDGNRDGVPVALMEAMAVGLPVVSTGVSGIPEIVRHGESGLLAQPGDPASLAEALEALLEDAGLRRRLAAGGRGTIEARFDVEREAERLLASFARGGVRP